MGPERAAEFLLLVTPALGAFAGVIREASSSALPDWRGGATDVEGGGVDVLNGAEDVVAMLSYVGVGANKWRAEIATGRRTMNDLEKCGCGFKVNGNTLEVWLASARKRALR